MAVTLRDIAKATQTSVSTVSRVLSGGAIAGRLSTATRQRIQAEAQRLGYQPNLAARALRLRRSNTIALVCRMSSPFFSRIAHLIDLRLHAHGYWLMCCNSDEDPQREAEFLRHLSQRGIDGAIVVPTTNDAAQIKNNLPADYPMIILQRPVEGLGPTVAAESQQQVELLCQTLQTTGVQRLALITSPQSAFAQTVHAQAGKRGMTVVFHFEGPLERKTGRQAFHMMQRQPELRIQAILCNGPIRGHALLEAMSSSDLPDPLPIIALDDSLPFMNWLPIPIVCAVDNITALAEASVNALLSLLDNQIAGKPKVAVPPLTLFPCDIEYNKAFSALERRG